MRSLIFRSLLAVALSAGPSLAQPPGSKSSDNGSPLNSDSHADMNTGGDHSEITRDPAASAEPPKTANTSGSAPLPSSSQDKTQPNQGEALQNQTAPAVNGAGHIDF